MGGPLEVNGQTQTLKPVTLPVSTPQGNGTENAQPQPTTQPTITVDPAYSVTITGEQASTVNKPANRVPPTVEQASNANRPVKKGIFSFIVDSIASPIYDSVLCPIGNAVADGAEWFGDQVEAFIGLFSKAEQTTAKMNEDLESGHREAAADKARDFLSQEMGVSNVGQLGTKETLRLYDQAMTVLRGLGNLVTAKIITAKDALKIAKEQANLLCNLNLTDQQRAEGSLTAQGAVGQVMQAAPAEQLKDCAEELIQAQNAIYNLASMIVDEGLRASVLSQLDCSNGDLAKTISDKLRSTADSECATDFINDIARLRGLNITCKLTEEIMQYLLANRIEQRNLDRLAAERKAGQVGQERHEDEQVDLAKDAQRVAMAKINEKSKHLRALQRKLEQKLGITPEDVRRTNADYIYTQNQPTPIVRT